MIGLVLTVHYPYALYGLWLEQVNHAVELLYDVMSDHQPPDHPQLDPRWIIYEHDDLAILFCSEPILGTVISKFRSRLRSLPKLEFHEIITDDNLDTYSNLLPVDTIPECELENTTLSDLFGKMLDLDGCLEDMSLEHLVGADSQIISLTQPPVTPPKKSLDVILAKISDEDPDIIIMGYILFAKTLSLSEGDRFIGMIRYLAVRRGIDASYFGDISPIVCDRMELESEILKSDPSYYLRLKSEIADYYLGRLVTGYRECSKMAYLDYAYSNFICEILFGTLVFCEPRSDALWLYQDGLWEIHESGAYLWNFISGQVPKYLSLKAGEEDTKDILAEVARVLGSGIVRRRIFQDVKMGLYDESFSNRLDSQGKIVGLKNGVYDLEKGKLRKPLPSDYLSIVAPSSYLDPLPPVDSQTRLMDTLRKIFPREDLLNFFIRSCTSFLEGYNQHKVYYIWYGKGNNAKTAIQTLVNRTFGNYCVSLPTSLITGKRNASANATPDMYHLKNKLVAFMQEPNPDERIRGGMVKELTGNDQIYVRNLYKPPEAIRVKAKLILVSNNILDVPDMDAALKRRTIVLPFLSTFLPDHEKAKPGQEYVYDVDPQAEKVLSESSDLFMSLLLREFPAYSRSGLEIPNFVQQTTDRYLVAHNKPRLFVREFVVPSFGNVINLDEIYDAYKDWSKINYPSEKIVNLKKFCDSADIDTINNYIPDSHLLYEPRVF